VKSADNVKPSRDIAKSRDVILEAELEDIPDISDLSSSNVKDRRGEAEQARDIIESDANAFEFFVEFFFGFKMNKWHKRWVQFQLDNPITLFLGPRNTNKSRILTHYFILWRICRDTTRHLRQLIASKTDTKATFLMRGITKQVYVNPLLWVFEIEIDKERPVTSAEVSWIPPEPRYNPDPNLAAVGLGSSIIAPHFDVIYVDDSVDKSNASGRAKEKLLQDIDFDLWGMMERGREEIHFVGSRYDDEDPYANLERRKGFKIMAQSIFTNEKETSTIDPQNVPMSSVKLAQDTLSATAFRLLYRMKRQKVMRGGMRVMEEWFTLADTDRPMDFEERWMGIDLAGFSVGESQEDLSSSSDSSLVVIGRDSGGFCLLDTWHDRISAPKFLELIHAKNAMFHPEWIAIENAALQVLFIQFTSYMGLPVRKYSARGYGAKEIRAGRLAHILSWGMRYLPTVDYSELLSLPSDVGDAAISVFDILGAGEAPQGQPELAEVNLSALGEMMTF